MATRSIAVRIKTEKVIASLEASLEKMRKEKESEKALKEKYDKDYEAWLEKVKKYALSMPKPKDTKGVTVGSTHYHLRAIATKAYTVEVRYEVPVDKVPPRPEEPKVISDWEYRDAVENIENALRLLNMTDQEEVSTGTYNKIAQYL
jgi:hypothetical protein